MTLKTAVFIVGLYLLLNNVVIEEVTGIPLGWLASLGIILVLSSFARWTSKEGDPAASAGQGRRELNGWPIVGLVLLVEAGLMIAMPMTPPLFTTAFIVLGCMFIARGLMQMRKRP